MRTRAAKWARSYVAGAPVRGRAMADAALAPAEWLYRLAVAARRAAHARGLLRQARAPLPVLSVGNLLVGGAGKTPVSAFLARRLAALGAHPAVVHGGYAADEPALHRSWNPDIPVVVGRSRVRAAREAAAAGADVAVLDDAFQHLALARSADLVLVPVERWTAAPRMLPRGPWREAPASLRFADLVGLTHRGAPAERVAEVRSEVLAAGAREVAEFVLEAVGWHRVEPVVRGAGGEADAAPPSPPGAGLGVCGVADPEGFRRSAARAGARLTALLIYPDHHDYDAGDLRRIAREAERGPVLTTAKDAVKLRSLAERAPVWELREEVRVASGADALESMLKSLLE